MIQIYTDTAHYTQAIRPYLADLLRPIINQRTLEQNRSVYGSVVDQYLLVDDMLQADWAVLLFAWNYYYRSGLISQAFEFIARARDAGKLVLNLGYWGFWRADRGDLAQQGTGAGIGKEAV